MIDQSFHMQNNLDDVNRLVMSLKVIAEGVLDQTTMFKFEICTAEALTNIVKHAGTKNKDEPIQVTITENDVALIVEIFDPMDAAAFDLRIHARELENVDPMAESGRGLGLIMQCADEVDYGPSGDRNRLVLQFFKVGK